MELQNIEKCEGKPRFLGYVSTVYDLYDLLESFWSLLHLLIVERQDIAIEYNDKTDISVVTTRGRQAILFVEWRDAPDLIIW